MEDPGPIFLSSVLVVALIFLNATFVAAEFAFARVRRTRVDNIAESEEEGPRRKAALKLQLILDDINDYISTCQVGITIASLSMGAIAEAQIEEMIAPVILRANLPIDLDIHVVSIILTVSIVTYFHVVLGEVVPKSLALAKPEEIGLKLSNFIVFIRAMFRFPVIILNGSANLVLKLMGVEPVFGEVVHSEDELKRILSSSQEEGILEEEEEEIIQNVFELNDTVAREVMVPRTDMVCLEDNLSVEEATEKIGKYCFSRYPLFRERLDNITGYVTLREILKAHAEKKTSTRLRDISTEAWKAPDGIYVIDLLKDLQKNKKPMAILIDEFGGTRGLVTVEDIVEEIFGEIHDEDEIAAEPIRKVGEGEYIVDGLVTLRDLNEELGTNFSSDHYETIGGFVYGLIGRDPKPGDKVEHQNAVLTVKKHSKQRVRSVKLVLT